ncbi:hypothetical protein JXA80_12635 [bacterium]|nr:hypothetical protein [candidate division CSSED10-310 bacterium]
MSQDSSDSVVQHVMNAAPDGRLTCADALRLAAMLNRSPLEISRIANQHKIKIVSCQLGCFK